MHRTPLQRGMEAPHSRAGKLLVLFAVLLPAILAVTGLVLDGGLMTAAARNAQHAADAAATAAAAEVLRGEGSPAAVAERYVQFLNNLSSASVTTNHPPTTGEHSGDSNYVEVIVRLPVTTHIMRLAGPTTVRVRSVAGSQDVTASAAVVVLDPDPPEVNVLSLPIVLPSFTPLLGGLEVLGLGAVQIDGAVLVNNEWGGWDENGQWVGDPSIRNACSCTPLLPLTRVKCPDLRVVGGVDNLNCYSGLSAGSDHPLTANRFPVPDPYADLPVPTTAADPANVSATYRGSVTVIGLPLIGPPVTLQPGVYDWIQVVSGKAIFQPGVYIIRGKNPLTQIGLSMIAGQVEAEGVMFYITNSSGYSTATGLPDSADGETSPGNPGVLNLVPSVVMDLALPGNKFSGLNAPGSPFHGMVLMQRRQDRRPILLIRQSLLGDVSFAGNVYAKWGEVILTGNGLFRSAFACGSLRILDVLNCQISPINPLPPAKDVYLVE